MHHHYRSIFLPIPSLSAEQASTLIDVLEAAVAELWSLYGDEIRLLDFPEEDEEEKNPEADSLPDFSDIF